LGRAGGAAIQSNDEGGCVVVKTDRCANFCVLSQNAVKEEPSNKNGFIVELVSFLFDKRDLNQTGNPYALSDHPQLLVVLLVLMGYLY
jgi:hypothetical protein